MELVTRSYVDDGDAHDPFHQPLEVLESKLDWIREAPRDEGILQLIVRRPESGAREEMKSADLSLTEGLVGDSWNARPSRRSADGGPHPDMQLNIMSARAADAVASAADRWSLAGDQLFVDMDLSEESLPPGTLLEIGDAVIEVTAEPHTGCANFSRRFGAGARKFVNSEAGSALKLRGINAKVVQPGTITVGDCVTRA